MTWRKLDFLKPNLQEAQCARPPERRLKPAPALRQGGCTLAATSGQGAIPSEGIQGDEWAAKIMLATYGTDERGIA
jgi:hypothetical protein